MCVPRRKGVKRLGGNRIEERVDWVCVRRLQARVGLKSKPGDIVLIDIVIDSKGLYLFMVVAGVRNALPVGTAISIRRIACYGCTAESKGTPEHGQRRAAGISVE